MEEPETSITGHPHYNLAEAKTAIKNGHEIKEYANQ
jgi:hypothetical protein